MKTYDALFLPYVGLTVTEHDNGNLEITGADVDWDDTFRNVWLNDEIGTNTLEVVADDGTTDAHGETIREAACGHLDSFCAVKPHANDKRDRQLAGAAALREVARLIEEAWKEVPTSQS